jgi:hypothetical protein
MKTIEHLFVTAACAAILSVQPAMAEETQTGSTAAQRELVAEVTSTRAPEVALPAPGANEASQRADGARVDPVVRQPRAPGALAGR